MIPLEKGENKKRQHGLFPGVRNETNGPFVFYSHGAVFSGGGFKKVKGG
jgi:hypothetical protein